MPIAGGPASVVRSSFAYPFGASWGPDDFIAFSSVTVLDRIRPDGRTADVLTTLMPGEYHHRLPHYLPRGKGVLFTVLGRSMDPHPWIAVMDEAHRMRKVLDDAADARYVATGHLAFLRQGSLMVVPFDLYRLRTTGQAIPLGIGVAQASNESATTEETDAGQFAVSGTGSLVYAAGGVVPDEQHSLVWVGQDGREEGLAVPFTAPFLAARLSPDGRRIAYTQVGTKPQVCVYDVKSGTRSELTSGDYVNFAIWTRDGQHVVFGSSTFGPPSLLERPVDRSAPPRTLAAEKDCVGQGPGSISPDGNLLAFWRQFRDKPDVIFIRDRRSGAITPIVEGRPGERLGYPESRRMAAGWPTRRPRRGEAKCM